MKKLFVLFCTVTMCLSLVACGNKSELEKYKKYETLIYYMEAEDYKAAYEELIRISRADGNTENAKENANEDKKEKIVEITMDNWQEYFEKRDVYRVEYNEFDEIEEIYFYGILALKDGIEIDSDKSDIAVEFGCHFENWYVNFNKDTGEFAYIERKDDFTYYETKTEAFRERTYEQIGKEQTCYAVEYARLGDNYLWTDSETGNDWAERYFIDEIHRIKGTLCIIE